jgi:hypothetical protein
LDAADSSDFPTYRTGEDRMSSPVRRASHRRNELLETRLEELVKTFAVADGDFSVLDNHPDGFSHSITRS